MNDILEEAKISEPLEASANTVSLDSVELKDGLAVGGVTYHTLFLRPLTARDLLEAQDAAEKVVTTKDGLALIASPARLSQELLRRQVKCLTEDGRTHNGPLGLEELGRPVPARYRRGAGRGGKHGRGGRPARRGRHGQAGAKLWRG